MLGLLMLLNATARTLCDFRTRYLRPKLFVNVHSLAV